MELSPQNYHSPENNNLTTSKVKDFLLDEKYFFDKHVLHTVEEEKSDAMTVGSMVDTAIDSGVETMKSLYIPVARRSKDGAGGLITEVTQTMFDEAMGLINSIMETTAYKELADFKRQVILSMDIGTNKYFGDKFVGMLDFLKVSPDGKSAVICDLKTSRTVQENKYYWHSVELGYWLQAASYVQLVSKTYNIPVKDIKFYHLVVQKDPKGIYKTVMFEFEPKMISEHIVVLNNLISEIISKEEFIKKDCSFSTAQLLTNPKSPVEAEKIDDDGWEKV